MTAACRFSGRLTAYFYATLEVNGEDVIFLTDTGAANLVLTRRAAAAAGNDVDNLSYFLKAKTANGIVSGAPVTLTWVALGSFQDRNVSAVVNGSELHTSLLGMSYLKRFQSFRIECDRMILVR